MLAYVRTRVRSCGGAHARVCMCIGVCMCVRACLCVRFREWGCTCVCQDMCVRMWALMHVRLRVRASVRASVRACERARIYAGMIIALGAYIIIYSGAVCEYACAYVCV